MGKNYYPQVLEKYQWKKISRYINDDLEISSDDSDEEASGESDRSDEEASDLNFGEESGLTHSFSMHPFSIPWKHQQS